MDASLRVTTESDESAFMDIVDGKNVINIPLFQRAFKWTKANIEEFRNDIETVLSGDEESESQFLGVVVFVPQDTKASKPNLQDAVDGQQRLTTCYLNVMAIVHAAIEHGQTEFGLNIAKSYLLTRPFPSSPTNTKLIPSAVDRQQFAQLWETLANHPLIPANSWGEYSPKPPAPAGDTTGPMTKAYANMLRHAKDLYKDQGHATVEDFLEVILAKLSFVQINLKDPIKAPQIFERLNARGQKISTADLVRNEIFSRVADDAAKAKAIFDSSWEPFARKYSEQKVPLENLLFPYGLLSNSAIKKDGLFQHLRKQWSDALDPRDIIRDLDQHSGCLFAIENGDVTLIEGKALKAAFKRLHLLRAPSSMYPFLFAMIRDYKDQKISESSVVGIISVLESFLFRRAICGIEPTGLHAVFKGLWIEMESGGHTVENLTACIARRPTVPWPKDNQFRDAILTTNFYSKNIKRYGMLEFERSRKAESPADYFEIEHIYPQSPHEEWAAFIPIGEESRQLVNTWGNLAPITQLMNPSISNSVFSKKVAEYGKSVFASLREIASDGSTVWTLETIRRRSETIADWALTRWPHSP